MSQGTKLMVRPLAEVKKEAYIAAISEAIVLTGSQAQAAKALNVSYAKLRRLIKEYDITLTINKLMENVRRQRKLYLLTSEQLP